MSNSTHSHADTANSTYLILPSYSGAVGCSRAVVSVDQLSSPGIERDDAPDGKAFNVYGPRTDEDLSLVPCARSFSAQVAISQPSGDALMARNDYIDANQPGAGGWGVSIRCPVNGAREQSASTRHVAGKDINSSLALCVGGTPIGYSKAVSRTLFAKFSLGLGKALNEEILS